MYHGLCHCISIIIINYIDVLVPIKNTKKNVDNAFARDRKYEFK